MPDRHAAIDPADAMVPVAVLVRERIPVGTPSPATLARWRSVGVRGARLRAVRVGGRWYCTPADLEKFIAATNGGESVATPTRKRREAVVSRELDALGI